MQSVTAEQPPSWIVMWLQGWYPFKMKSQHGQHGHWIRWMLTAGCWWLNVDGWMLMAGNNCFMLRAHTLLIVLDMASKNRIERVLLSTPPLFPRFLSWHWTKAFDVPVSGIKLSKSCRLVSIGSSVSYRIELAFYADTARKLSMYQRSKSYRYFFFDTGIVSNAIIIYIDIQH